MTVMGTSTSGERSEIFWGEIAPCEHLVQIYPDETVFLDTLEGFVAGGIRAGDGVIVIATTEHIARLDARLTAAGIDVGAASLSDQYIAIDAEYLLNKFMI